MKIKCCKAPNLKMTKKLTLILSVILGVILAAGIALCVALGFNSSIKDTKTVVVETEYYTYHESSDEIKGFCNEAIAENGLKAEDVKISEKGLSGYDVVYVFDKDTSMDTLRLVKEAIDDKLEKGGYVDKMVTVTTQEMEVTGTMAKNYVARGLIALAIFAVASLVYVWIRYKLFAALYTLGGNVLSVALTTALIALTRIPVTPAVAAVIAASALFSTVIILAFFNNLRAAQKEEGAAKSAEEIVSSSIAWKETTVFSTLLGVALLVMICVGKAAIAWLSLSAILAILAAAFIGLLFVPATFVPAKKLADKIAASKSTSYKGAKKGDKVKSVDEEIVD